MIADSCIVCLRVVDGKVLVLGGVVLNDAQRVKPTVTWLGEVIPRSKKK